MEQDCIDSDTERDELSEVLVRVGEGDHEAFRQLYEQTIKRVYSVVRRILIDPEFSHDTAQEVYLQVWQSAERFNPAAGSPLAWLITIAHRRAVDKVRHEQSFKDRQDRHGASSHFVAHDQVAETVAGTLEKEAVTTSLASLSRIQRESIHLAFYGGLTYAEIAASLNVPLPTIKSRIRDGLRHLRNDLAD